MEELFTPQSHNTQFNNDKRGEARKWKNLA